MTTVAAEEGSEVFPTADRYGDAPLLTRVIDATIGLFREYAFHDVSLQHVANAAGMDLDAVQRMFPSRDGLLVAVLDRWNGDRMGPILTIAAQRGAVPFLRAIVIANIADPALMSLLTATVNIAATPNHPIAPLLRQRWVSFHAIVQRALARDIAEGREPETMEPARGAEQLIAMYEGLQLQSMLRPHMDVLAAYDRAVTRLRDGWSHQYQPPVWDI